ncbi:MAG: transposase [Actinomycetota bacterium]|nr:transposase [Actinomycetota bacterium]
MGGSYDTGGYSGRFDEAADMLAEAAHHILAFTAFPKPHWRLI